MLVLKINLNNLYVCVNTHTKKNIYINIPCGNVFTHRKIKVKV